MRMRVHLTHATCVCPCYTRHAHAHATHGMHNHMSQERVDEVERHAAVERARNALAAAQEKATAARKSLEEVRGHVHHAPY